MRIRRARAWAAGASASLALAPALAGCAGSLHPAAMRAHQHGDTRLGSLATRHQRLCEPQALSAIARDLRVAASDVRTSTVVASNGMPQCTFRIVHPRRVAVVVNVDDGPQVEWRLGRTVDEASQIFGPPPPGWHAPIGLYGLGPNASWFPESGWLMAANGTDLFTVTIDWPHASRAARIHLARAAVTPYVKGGHRPGRNVAEGHPGGN